MYRLTKIMPDGRKQIIVIPHKTDYELDEMMSKMEFSNTGSQPPEKEEKQVDR